MLKIQLKSNSKRSLLKAHPWVYRSEIRRIPNDLQPGDPVELRDAEGDFVSRGYANPRSEILYREITKDPEAEPFSSVVIERRLRESFLKRAQAGLLSVSFRWLYSEGDHFPGLIIDRFLSSRSNSQVLVLQPSTAGIECHLDEILESLKLVIEGLQEAFELPGVDQTTFIIRRNSNWRKREGLRTQAPEILGAQPEDLKDYGFWLAHKDSRISLSTDLFEGQKTGFFFDQRQNITMTLSMVKPIFERAKKENRAVRILDLCCYIGQWSAHLAKSCLDEGLRSEIYILDSSEKALQFAQKNLESLSDQIHPVEADVLRGLSELEESSFDIVICDPPAFIKKKEDLRQGTAAYVKLNREAIKRVSSGGLYVSCSCSGSLSESDFEEALKLASSKAKREVSWVGRGGHAVDHPLREHFPEGQYLKCRLGWLK